MQTRVKRYNVTIRGNVQHIGYRGMIEGTARKFELKGYVFNDVDQSVKIVCEGLNDSIEAFLDTIKDFARADIERIETKEITDEIYLPHVFSRVATDEYYEFSRKFDIGLEYIDEIKMNTGEMKGTLTDMRGALNSVNGTLGNMNGTLESFVIGQRDFNTELKDHNQRLEKILEKLAEK